MIFSLNQLPMAGIDTACFRINEFIAPTLIKCFLDLKKIQVWGRKDRKFFEEQENAFAVNQFISLRTKKEIAIPITLEGNLIFRRYSSKYFKYAFGIYDFHEGERRQLATLHLFHKFKGYSYNGIKINRVAWRYNNSSELLKFIQLFFRATPDVIHPTRLELYVDFIEHFESFWQTLYCKTGAQIHLFDRAGREIAWSRKKFEEEKKVRVFIPDNELLKKYYEQPNGAWIGNPRKSELAERIYDSSNARSNSSPVWESDKYLKPWLDRIMSRELPCAPLTRAEAILRSRKLKKLLGKIDQRFKNKRESLTFSDLELLPSIPSFFSRLQQCDIAERKPQYRPMVEALRKRAAKVGVALALAEYRRRKGKAYPSGHLIISPLDINLDSLLCESLISFFG